MANYPGTITDLRYLKRSNLVPTQQVQKGYYRELIHSYGIDATYFRHNCTFYPFSSGNNVDYTYGEKSTMSYTVSAPLLILAEMFTDINLLNKFGIETNSNGSCYILMDEFTEAFRDTTGVLTSAYITSSISGTVSANNGNLSAYFSNSELDCYVLSSVTNIISGNIHFNSFSRVPVKYNDYTAFSDAYITRYITGSANGNYATSLDISGNGSITGNISASLWYYSTDTTIFGSNWKISPQVGDFFRINFDELNNEEYEITRLYERSLQTDGLNPLLYRYLWKMDVVRRDSSYETVSAASSQEEQLTISKSDENTWHDVVSNEIFDYANEAPTEAPDNKVDLDKVYGGY